MSHTTNRLTKFMLIAMFLAVLLVMFTLLHHSPLVEAQSNGFAGGSGTEDDPYQIATADQLNNVRNHLDKHFILTANIDLLGTNWDPIGNDSAPLDRKSVV